MAEGMVTANHEELAGDDVRHSDYLSLRNHSGPTEVLSSGPSAQIPSTMPNGRRPGKRRSGAKGRASDNMGSHSLLATARQSDMADEAAPPASDSTRPRSTEAPKQGTPKPTIAASLRRLSAASSGLSISFYPTASTPASGAFPFSPNTKRIR